MKKQICELLDISDVSYYRWKKDRLIITFLEKYFTKDEITEYIQIKKIEKLELIKNYSTLELKELTRETLYINKKNKTELEIFEYQGMNEKKENDLSEYFKALKSVAIATKKEDELLTDIKELIKKYIDL